MVAKTIIEVDIDREQSLQKFKALYDKLQAQVKMAPAEWVKVNKQIDVAEASFAAIVTANVVQNDLLKKQAKVQEDSSRAVVKTENSWSRIARYSKQVSGSIADTTRSLLKWSAISGTVTGLLGAGGLYGLDRLAYSVSAGRRSSLGLGVSYGEQNAFNLNYGQMLNSGTILSSISAALHDPNQRSLLFNAGVGNAQGDAASVSVAAVRSIKALVDRTPSNMLGTLSNANGRNLGALGFDLPTLIAMKGMSSAEFQSYANNFNTDKGTLGLNPQNQIAWQSFAIQLQRAGATIENVFVKALAPLAPDLTKLSNEFAGAISELAKSGGFKTLVHDVGEGLVSFAKYIGSPSFKSDISTFATDVGLVAKSLEGWLEYLGVLPKPKPSNAGTIFDNNPNRPAKWYDPGSWLSGNGGLGWSHTPNASNPGNLRAWWSNSGFQSFASPADGLRAMAKQLLLYEDRDHLNTLSGIITKYAPPSENNTAAYIKAVAARTGIGANQPVNLHDNTTMAAVISAMTKQENAKTNYTPGVVVTVLNNTGGNAIVSASGAAVGQ